MKLLKKLLLLLLVLIIPAIILAAYLYLKPSGVSSTKPQAPAPVSSYVYDDGLATGWEEYLWDNLSADYSNTNPVVNGQYSMAITPGQGWTAWHAWSDDAFDTSPYRYLTFSVQASTAKTWWEVQFLDQKTNKINQETFVFSPSTNTWESYTIDLKQYGVDHTSIHAIRFWYVTGDINTSTLYIDDLGFGGIAPTPEPTPTPQTLNYSFTIDAAQVVNPFRKQMLGVAHGNWDHSWGKYFPGDIPMLAEIYKAANIGLIRYAGGSWANFVMWERSPQKTPYGKYHADPLLYHPDFSTKINTSNEYNFHYGMDEIDSLARLARAAGSDVLIQVNISSDDPYMWADLVRYANIEKNYGFKYWELGNEIDLECQQGNTTTCISEETYETRAASYIAAMKAVDPAITIIAGVPSAGHDIVANQWEDTRDMSRYLRAGEKAGADALSYHWYADCNLKSLENVFAWKYDVKDTAWQNMYSRYWSQLGPARVQQEILLPADQAKEIGVTELNIDACDMERAPVNSNHIAALWYADVLGRMAYNGIDFVTWYEGYGNGSQGFPAIFIENEYFPTAETIYLRPSYSTIFMYGNYFGDEMVKTSDPDPEKISLYASLDHENQDKLFVIVTNLSPDTIHGQIDVSGFVAIQGIKYELKNANPLSREVASNGIDHGSTINGVQLTANNISTAAHDIPGQTVLIEQGNITETFSPYSVTALVLEKSSIP